MTRRQARALAIALAATGAAEHVPAVVPVSETPAAPLAPEASFSSATAVESPAVERSTPHGGAGAEASVVDEFEAAARLFSFTGETPVQAARSQGAPADPSVDAATGGEPIRHVAPRRRAKRMSAKRLAATSFSVGVLGVVGLLTIGMTMPAEAVAAANGTMTTAAASTPLDADGGGDAGKIQAYVSTVDSAATRLDRSASYSTATLTQMAGTVGIQYTSSAVFTNNPNCPIQWPFAVGVPISYGFGPRPGEFHEGVDFTPGAGAHIQAIADGTVRIATENGGGYGVMIIIDHVIDGTLVSTRYGHMEHGSLQVKTGDHVKVGEYIGRTGDTGRSYGAHTHVEVLMNGTTPIDPLPWLRAHNQC